MTDSEAIQAIARQVALDPATGKLVAGGLGDVLDSGLADLRQRVAALETKLPDLTKPAKLTGSLEITPGQ